MRKDKVTFDEYLSKKLKDPVFRGVFLRQREELRLGIEIARLRKELGISQSELAERAGMRKQNVARLERPDYRSFTLSSLERIALALGRRLKVRFVQDNSPGRREQSKTPNTQSA